MKTLHFSPTAQIMMEGIKKAIPNMIYGDLLFVLSLLLRSLFVGGEITTLDLEGFLFLIAALALLFFLGIFIAILPAAIGGAVLGIWLNRSKESNPTWTGLAKGALVGFVGMLIVCAIIYPLDQPHGLPDPSFPFNAAIAITISTLAGARTGMQLAKALLHRI